MAAIQADPLGLLVAFGAGMLSFLSPCVLPLVPAYLSMVSGLSAAELSALHPVPEAPSSVPSNRPVTDGAGDGGTEVQPVDRTGHEGEPVGRSGDGTEAIAAAGAGVEVGAGIGVGVGV